MRRRWSKARRAGSALVAVLTLGVVLAACSSSSSTHSSAASTASPIKVGYLVPLTGTAAANGKDEEDGFNLGLDTFGRVVDGHPIEVTYLDTGSSPTVALSDAQELITQDHVQVVEGPLLANQIAAVAPYVMGQGVPEDDLYLSSPTQMNDYKKYGLGFTSGWDGYQPSSAGAKWAYDTMHWTRVATIGEDYAFGWQTVGGFDAEFSALGGTVVKSIWVPLDATDIASYVSEIPTDVQAVYVELLGSQAVQFFTDYASYGLKGKIPVLGVTTLTDQSVLPSVQPLSDAEGTYVASQYCDDLPTTANQDFANAYHAKYGVYPAYYSEAGYTKAEILVDALKALHGDVTSGKALARAMLAVRIEAPRGPVSISSQTFSPIQNSYICKVEDVGGTLRNVPIVTDSSMQPWGFLSESTWLHDFAVESVGPPPGT